MVALSPCILHLSQTVTYIISGVHRSSHIHQDGKTCKMCTVALNNSIICLIVCPLQSLGRPRPTPKPTCIQSNSSIYAVKAKTSTMSQVYAKTLTMLPTISTILRITKVPEYTARVGIIFTKFLKCLKQSRVHTLQLKPS